MQATIKVLGQVQGVFFRAFAAEKARELKLVGWAKNEEDGTVKIIAQGEEENLKKLIECCKQGPKFAKVDRVEVEWKETTDDFKNFLVK